MNLPSPRTGEIPPALSPLDAFALQSRMLAQRFDDEAKFGRRISRLPPVMVENHITNRPGYQRSASGESEVLEHLEEGPEETSPVTYTTTQEDQDKPRPVSHYPRFSNISRLASTGTPFYDADEQQSKKEEQDYFGIAVPRATSPEPVDPKTINIAAPTPSPKVPSLTNSVDTVASHPRTMTNESQRSQRSQMSERGLAVPQSPRFPRSPRSFQSIRSVPADSGDEDAASVNGSQRVSSRKFSGSSGMSRPQSPFSPWMRPVHRSPSMTSEYSMNSSQPPPRPMANFSRPMSSSGHRPSTDTRPSIDSRPSFETRPSTDMPHRHMSNGSVATKESSVFTALSRQSSQDNAVTPYANIDTPSQLDQPAGDYFSGMPASTPRPETPSSYTYARYALPRGRTVERTSGGIRDSWIQRQFDWDDKREEPLPKTLDKPAEIATPPITPSTPATPQVTETPRHGRDLAVATSTIRSRSADPRTFEKSAALHRSTASVKTESTDRTIRPTPLHQKSASADLTAEEHLEIGIQAHSLGETNKSTYHLRLAAIAGLPTGMLLYALACRHGWGMRPNQAEGVQWLRKAIQTSGLDVVDAEDRLEAASRISKHDPVAEAAERKKRKAQYALAIYELGISSMNGWGCKKDKTLAVRCYEIAGSWGDGDALAEAGFCYTQGVGVKKDLHKAAALYRQAADTGMSMAGNSWYVFDLRVVEFMEQFTNGK